MQNVTSITYYLVSQLNSIFLRVLEIFLNFCALYSTLLKTVLANMSQESLYHLWLLPPPQQVFSDNGRVSKRLEIKEHINNVE